MTQMFTVKEARERKQPPMTQIDLAAKCHVDQTYISLMERGLRIPSDDVKERLAKALGIRPVQLRFSEPEPDAIGTRGSDSLGHSGSSR